MVNVLHNLHWNDWMCERKIKVYVGFININTHVNGGFSSGALSSLMSMRLVYRYNVWVKTVLGKCLNMVVVLFSLGIAFFSDVLVAKSCQSSLRRFNNLLEDNAHVTSCRAHVSPELLQSLLHPSVAFQWAPGGQVDQMCRPVCRTCVSPYLSLDVNSYLGPFPRTFLIWTVITVSLFI